MTSIAILVSTHFDSNTHLLCEISDIYGLQQVITAPTRITESSSSLIDVIFTNCINRVVCSGVLHVGISDPSLIYVYHKLSLEFAFKGHSTKTFVIFVIFVILTEKTFTGIFLNRNVSSMVCFPKSVLWAVGSIRELS